MNRQFSLGAFFVLLMVAAWPFDTFAGSMAVKCAANEERAWLYDSVTTLNVAAKLKCGENVEVLGQESGYVKVRTASGIEGYLPANNLPNIPVPNAGTNAAATPAQTEQPTLASLARAAAAARHAREAAASTSTESTSAPAASAPAVSAPSSSVQPAVAANAISAAQPKIATPVSASPAKAAAAGAPATVTPVSSTTPTPAAPMTSGAHTTPSASTPSSLSRTKPRTGSKSSPAAVTTSTKPAAANPTAPRSGPGAKANAPVHTAVATPAAKMPNAPSAQPANNDIYVTSAVSASATPKAASVRTVANTSEDDDDSYLTKPVSESDDPACRTYISGYGLSPGQFKWLEDNRKKKYPSICPAASPMMVDYVIIFTHDVDFFNYTMPTPVHTEAGGFSDWTPMLEFDTSVISHSDIDKSRREYVWVFHVKRGVFDPAKFSPHRKFQYSKVESKYTKTVEDAFDFIQGQSANR